MIDPSESGLLRSVALAEQTFPQDASLTPTLKSYGISLLLHASLVAALYVIPTSLSQQFSQRGQVQVISIEATQEHPTAISVAAVEVERLPLMSDWNDPHDRMAETEPIDSRDLNALLSEPRRDNESSLRSPASVPPTELPLDQRLMLRRRPPAEITPQVVSIDTPARLTPHRQIAEPPAAIATTVEHFVGIEGDSSADLSNNRPPVYPSEAVRRRLEGVVLLQLSVSSKGNVETVEIIQSSGHAILDQAAADAVKSWQGQPAKKWGRPVGSVERLPIRFRL